MGLTLIIYIVSLGFFVAIASYRIWVNQEVYSKFGTEWQNLWIQTRFAAVVLVVKCSILFLGNSVSATILGSAFNRIVIAVGVVFVLGNSILALRSTSFGIQLVWLPFSCAILVIGIAILKKKGEL